MTKTHRIYFLRRADGLIKIGTTTNLDVRIASLAKSHGPLEIVRVINGGRRREGELHHRYRKYSEFGEWFRNDAGALEIDLGALEDGPEISVSATDARDDWERGEAALLVEARRKLEETLRVRMQRLHVKREAALAGLQEDYGFSPWFLRHLQKQATTISAYGYQKLSEAFVAELEAGLVHWRAEIGALLREGKEDEDVLSISRDLDGLEAEFQRRRAMRAELAARKAVTK